MTDDEIIKAVAELDGFRFDGNVGFIRDGIFHTIEGQAEDNESCGGIGGWYEPALPPYLTSRDAIVSVIKKQNIRVKADANAWLECKMDVWPAFLANPRQLCEALLRAVGKWNDE